MYLLVHHTRTGGYVNNTGCWLAFSATRSLNNYGTHFQALRKPIVLMLYRCSSREFRGNMQVSCPGAAPRHRCRTQVSRQPYGVVLTPLQRHISSKSKTVQSCQCRHLSSLHRICPSTQQLWRLSSASRRPCRQRLQALAMVNIEFAQPALWLGMGLIGGGLALYQLRRYNYD